MKLQQLVRLTADTSSLISVTRVLHEATDASPEERAEVLHHYVVPYLCKHCPDGEVLSEATNLWRATVASGAFDYSKSASIYAYLQRVIKTAKMRAARARQRCGELLREDQSMDDKAVAKDPTPKELLGPLLCLDEDGVYQPFARRKALCEYMFPSVTFTPVSEMQAKTAVRLANTHSPSQVAAEVFSGDGDGVLASSMFPFLAARSRREVAAVLEVFAERSDTTCRHMLRQLLHRDGQRQAGYMGDHLCRNKMAPKLLPLSLAS